MQRVNARAVKTARMKREHMVGAELKAAELAALRIRPGMVDRVVQNGLGREMRRRACTKRHCGWQCQLGLLLLLVLNRPRMCTKSRVGSISGRAGKACAAQGDWVWTCPRCDVRFKRQVGAGSSRVLCACWLRNGASFGGEGAQVDQGKTAAAVNENLLGQPVRRRGRERTAAKALFKLNEGNEFCHQRKGNPPPLSLEYRRYGHVCRLLL